MARTKKRKTRRTSRPKTAATPPGSAGAPQPADLPGEEHGPGWGIHPPGPFVPSEQLLRVPTPAAEPSGPVREEMLDRGGHSIRREVGIGAPPATVFDALIRPPLVQRWWADEVRIEPRRGGVWQIRRLTDAEPENGRLEEIQPPRRLAWSWAMTRVPDSTLVSLLLEPTREGALLQVLHSGFGQGNSWDLERRHHSLLWDETLWRLRGFLEERRVLRTVREEVEVSAPAERAWRALTTPREINAWWADVSRFDPRPGGEFRLVWEGTGESFGILEEVVPPGRLKLHDQATGAVFAFAIGPSDRGCTVAVVHSCFGRDATWTEGTERFWRNTLRALKDHVETPAGGAGGRR